MFGYAAVSLVVALVAVVLQIYATRWNDQALARDRRNAFELGVLVRLIEVCSYNRPGSVRMLQALLGVLPEEDLPGIRQEAKHGRVPSNDALTPFMAEYFEAVNRRLRDH
jgi:hypothetical protein